MQVSFRRLNAVRALALGVLTLAGCVKQDPAAEARALDAQITAGLTAADQQLAAGQAAPAIAALEALRAAHPDHLEIVEALAQALAQTHQNASAATLFETIAQRDPGRRALFVYAAGLYAGEGDHAGATRAYRAYLDNFPTDAAAWKNFAQELDAQNEFESAIKAYTEALKNKSDHLPTAADSAAIGLLYLHLNKPDAADQWLRDALLRQPAAATAAAARLGLLQLAVQKQNWPAAEQLVNTLDAAPAARAALDASPLAATRDLLRQWRDAQTQLDQQRALAAQQAQARQAQLAALAQPAPPAPAVTPSPEVIPSNNEQPATPGAGNLTVAASPTGNLTAVASPAGNLTEVAPSAPDPHARIAPLLAAAHGASDDGRYAEAIQTYWQALNEDNAAPAAWLGLAQACYYDKNYPDALVYAQEAVRRAPDDPAYRLFYLEVVKAQTPARYQNELIAAREKFPADAGFALQLGDALRQTGDDRNATAVYQDYLQHAPVDDPRRAEVSAALATLPGA